MDVQLFSCLFVFAIISIQTASQTDLSDKFIKVKLLHQDDVQFPFGSKLPNSLGISKEWYSSKSSAARLQAFSHWFSHLLVV